ncbi:MAG: HAMP domain-containing sensor histidine kinase [Parvularculaceae bacterium]
MTKSETIAERLKRSLSSKLLALTIVFVFLAEIVVLIPSIANQRLDWLNARLEAAYLVGLALDAPGGEMIEPETAEQLFSTANILGVTLNREGARMMIMTPKLTNDQSKVMRYVNLSSDMPQKFVSDAWATVFSKGDHSIRVVGKPQYAPEDYVDMFVSQAALRADLTQYARNVLLLSLVISSLTAALVYWSLDRIIVLPVRRLTRNMMVFESNPEDESALLTPSERHDEIGVAERSLASLEHRTQNLLKERRRLAALGAGISKISHDLRNILASAQLMSDRLAKSEDPRVRKLAPKLISSLNRAIALSRDTLSYARMEPGALKLENTNISRIVDEVFDDTASISVEMRNQVSEMTSARVDPTQLYRALFNLVRNAVDALSGDEQEDAEIAGARKGEVSVNAREEGNLVIIEIADNGPGVPEGARAHLFEPFKGSFKPGGSGLGVAIAFEIARAHGGDLKLSKSDADGAVFELSLPAAPNAALVQ